MFQKAIDIDPAYAAAWAGLSRAYIWGYYSVYDLTLDQKAASKAAIDKARTLDPDSPEVQIALGFYHYYGENDYDRALEHFEHALANRPNNVEILGLIAFTKRRQNNWNECAGLLEKAVELNPRFVSSVLELGITYLFIRQYEEAERLLDRAVFLAPENVTAHGLKSLLYLLMDGDTERARRAMTEAAVFFDPAQVWQVMPIFAHVRTMPETYTEIMSRLPPEELIADNDTTWAYLGLAELNLSLGHRGRALECWNDVVVYLESNDDAEPQFRTKSCLGLAYAGLGRNEEAVRITRDALAEFPLSWDAILGTMVLEAAALTFVRAGEHEAAIDQLERLLSVPSRASRALFRLDPAWDPLREHREFKRLMESNR